MNVQQILSYCERENVFFLLFRAPSHTNWVIKCCFGQCISFIGRCLPNNVTTPRHLPEFTKKNKNYCKITVKMLITTGFRTKHGDFFNDCNFRHLQHPKWITKLLRIRNLQWRETKSSKCNTVLFYEIRCSFYGFFFLHSLPNVEECLCCATLNWKEDNTYIYYKQEQYDVHTVFCPCLSKKWNILYLYLFCTLSYYSL